MDRYAIRLVDETAQIDVTLWEAVGHRARRLREGHYVLITGLSTSKLYNDSNGQTTWYVNGSTNCGTEIVNGKSIFPLFCNTPYTPNGLRLCPFSVYDPVSACFIVFPQDCRIEYHYNLRSMSCLRNCNWLVYWR